MRKVCRHNINHANKIGFPMAEIEIDETHLYRPKVYRGLGLGDVWVVGGICRETKEVFVVRVDDRSQNTLDNIIRERVEPGSIIFTDGWRGYTGMLDRLGHYDGVTGIGGHFVCNHQVGYTADDIIIRSLNNTLGVLEVNTNTIERLWRDLKATIKSTQENRDIDGYVHRMADTYIERYMYFRNMYIYVF
jgi:transposase-like protein